MHSTRYRIEKIGKVDKAARYLTHPDRAARKQGIKRKDQWIKWNFPRRTRHSHGIRVGLEISPQTESWIVWQRPKKCLHRPSESWGRWKGPGWTGDRSEWLRFCRACPAPKPIAVRGVTRVIWPRNSGSTASISAWKKRRAPMRWNCS